MRILLDTHIFFWWIKNDRQLSKIAKAKITQATEVYVSSASIWELAIKIKLKKLHADIGEIEEAIVASDFLELPISARHAASVVNLPDIHRDPFDRILIAQAMCEPLTFLTADECLRDYTDLVEIVR